MSTEEPELLDQTAELLGSGGTIDLEQLQALHAAAQDGEPVVVHFKLRRDLDKRLDRYLTDRIPFLSRTGLQHLIRDGAVLVNDRTPKPSTKLRQGDRLAVFLPAPPSSDIPAEQHDFEVLHEDESIIVLNKPAGLLVHPAKGHQSGTLVNALAWHFQNRSDGELSKVGQDHARPGIVHRLDRHTSGVMVAAKNETAHWRLVKQFEERTVGKRYLAIVHGTPQLDRDRISAPLGMHPRDREKYAVRPNQGKEAITDFEVLEAFRGYSLLKCMPKTGRTHQIRVHLSHIRHPIVADDMYGGKPVYPWQLQDQEVSPQDPLLARCAHGIRQRPQRRVCDDLISGIEMAIHQLLLFALGFVSSAVAGMPYLHNSIVALGAGWVLMLMIARASPERYVVSGRVFGRDLL